MYFKQKSTTSRIDKYHYLKPRASSFHGCPSSFNVHNLIVVMLIIWVIYKSICQALNFICTVFKRSFLDHKPKGQVADKF